MLVLWDLLLPRAITESNEGDIGLNQRRFGGIVRGKTPRLRGLPGSILVKEIYLLSFWLVQVICMVKRKALFVMLVKVTYIDASSKNHDIVQFIYNAYYYLD